MAALAFAMGDPRYVGAREDARTTVVLVDTSASMQATDVAPNRLSKAKQEVQRLIDALGGADRMLVAQMDATTVPLTPLTGDPRLLHDALDRLEPTDVAADLPRALRFARDVLRGQSKPRVVLVSDGVLGPGGDAAARLREEGAEIDWMRIGEGGRNVAITAFSVRRYPLDKSRSQALVELWNPTERDEDVELTLVGDGAPIDVSRLRVKAGERLRRFFDDVSGADRTLEARLTLADGTRDAQPADDGAYARLPERRRARVLAVTNGNLYLSAALLLDEYLDVVEVTPADYPADGHFDVTIFDDWVPPSPPDTPAIYLNPVPPEGTQGPFEVTATTEHPFFDHIEREHPIVRFTALRDVNIAQALEVELQDGDRVVAGGRNAPLIVTGTRAGERIIAFLFDVRRSDLPLRVAWPLLLLNSIDFFVQEDAGYLSSYETGRTWHVPVPRGAETATLITPSGEERAVPVVEGRAVASGRRAGFYTLRTQGESGPVEDIFAANLGPSQEAVIAPAESLDDRRGGRRAAGDRTRRRAHRALDVAGARRARRAPDRVVHLPPEAHRMSRRVRIGIGLGLALASGAAIAFAVFRWAGQDAVTFALEGEDYEILAPRYLALIGLTPLVFFGLQLSLADLPRAQRWLGAALRALLVAVLALALARVARTTDVTRISTVFLVDVSDSVTDASLEAARTAVQEAWNARGDDDVQLVTFARDPALVPLAGDEVPRITRHLARHEGGDGAGGDGAGDGAGSNLQAALQLAYGLFPPGHLRRAVILSDGGQTEGDLLSEAARAARFGVKLYARPYREGVPREVAVRDLVIPERLQVGEPFPIRAHVFSTSDTRARIRLYQGETLNGLDGVRDVELHPGDNEIELRSVVRVAGPVTYALSVEPEGPDRFRANDRFATTVVVPGRPSVLYVEGSEGRASYLARALAAGDFEVDVRSPRSIPTSLRELERYDFVILSDVPADQVTLTQQDAIERYVRDLGGGFLMAGGENSFGLGGWQNTRIERLLPVRMDAERRRDQPSLALALVIDKSGSMNGQKIELAKDAAGATAEMLGGEDYIEVVGFDSQPSRVVRMQSARNRIQIMRDIGRLAARGGTAIFPALDMAYQDLVVTRARIKHVILLTDGQTQEAGIPELVQAMSAEGITVSTVGLGSDVNRALLAHLASLGGGRAYFTQDPHNVPRIFMRETSTVARSNVVEEYFRPTVSEPADFLRGVGIESAPFLHGYVATRAKPSPAQVVLVSELGEPILARWRVGLGWSLAWTSDVKNRWSVEWLRWPGYSRFWAQLVREHMRQRRRQTLDMHADVADEEVHVVVDAVGADDEFMNDLTSTLHVEGPMGAAHDARLDEDVPLSQTAPGRYEARFPLERYGSFVLTAEHQRDGRTVAESHAQLSNPYPREYMTFEPDVALLERAASLTGGTVDPSVERLFDAAGEHIEHHEELWPRLLFLALFLFVADLLLRRVRLFDRKFRAGSAARRS